MMDILGYGAFFLTIALSYGIIALGLNVQWGQTGLFNVGVAGFVAIGAYVSGLLTSPAATGRVGGFDLPILVGWAAAFAVGGLASYALGWLTVRLRSDYLAITTFGFAVTVQLAALNLESITGGPFGMSFIPRPFAFLANDPVAFGLANLAIVAITLLVAYLAVERLSASPWGRVLRAIREDEVAAVSLGKSATRFRLQAFAVGGALMGLGGAVQGHFIGFIAPDNYLPLLTFQVWTMLIVGGSGNNRGAIAGSVLVWGLWAVSASVIGQLMPAGEQARGASLQIVLIGVALCIILLLRPRGLIGERRIVSRHLGGDSPKAGTPDKLPSREGAPTR